jgi:hypothetical protein
MYINIFKKNRKYYAAKLKNGYKCKVVIDSNSQNLELGEQELLLDDVSVSTKYGTDVIYKLSAPAEAQKAAGIVTLKSEYNSVLIKRCRELGGSWDGDAGAWTFSDLVTDEVEELDVKYNSTLVAIEIAVNDELYESKGPVELAGIKIAQAWGRDSGAKLGKGIALIAGEINSGGSAKNWCTEIYKGSIIRTTIPEMLIEDIESGDYGSKISVKRLETDASKTVVVDIEYAIPSQVKILEENRKTGLSKYRELQRKLKELRVSGVKLKCKLNVKMAVLEAEFNRVTNK